MSNFKIDIQETGLINIVNLKGFLDAHTAPELEKIFQKFLDEQKYNIVVNCKELNYISSAGLGVFMAYIEDVRKHNGDIKLSTMSAKVFNTFDLLGFPLLYDITTNDAEAVKKFEKPKK